MNSAPLNPAAGEAEGSLASKPECLALLWQTFLKGPRREKKNLVLEEQISVKSWIYGARFGPAAINEACFTGRTWPRMAATERINKKAEI